MTQHDDPDSQPSMTYTDQSAWIDPPGRADHIDEIADSFERREPRPAAAESFWPEPVAWPSGRSWRADEPYEPELQRRAG